VLAREPEREPIACRYRGAHGERHGRGPLSARRERPQLYERETVPTRGRLLAELMLAHVSLHAGDRVLDAAWGTGIVTRVAVQRYGDPGHVVGLDLNAGMLEVVRAHTPATPVPIEWRHGDVCALPFPDGRCEAVLCQQGWQFIPDPLVALQEMRRVLVPRGRLAFTVFSEIPAYYAALADALAHYVRADAATTCLSRYALREATTLRQLVEDTGLGAIEMRVLEVLRRLPASAASVVAAMARAPYACEVAAVEEAVRQAIGQEVSAALHAYRDRAEVATPHRSHLVQAGGQESRNNKGRSSAKESVVNESRFDAHASMTSQRRGWGQSATGWKREWETWERGPNLFGLLILPHLSTTRTPRHQLLIPGGRLAAAVWGSPAHALAMSLPMRIIRQRRGGRSTLLR